MLLKEKTGESLRERYEIQTKLDISFLIKSNGNKCDSYYLCNSTRLSSLQYHKVEKYVLSVIA